YPEGPQSSPLVGNMFDVSVPYLHLKLTEWSRKYGDFFAFTMASTAVVVLSSPDVLNDLIVKTGQEYTTPIPTGGLIYPERSIRQHAPSLEP
ncbi:hypothetical protein LTR29_018141, partial [Friedmanniomyces endolithicus]